MHGHSAFDEARWCAKRFLSVDLVSENSHAKVFVCRISSGAGQPGSAYCLKLLRAEEAYLSHQAHLLERLARSSRSSADRCPARFFGMPRVLASGLMPTACRSVPGAPLYLLTPWIEGVALTRMIAGMVCGGQRVPLSEVLSLLLSIALNIRELGWHNESARLVHQDIKPSNIVVSLSPYVQTTLVDFDTAFFLDGSASAVPCGSFGYTAPEGLLRGDGWPNSAFDVFSFGIVAHEVLTGRWPYPFSPRLRDGLSFWTSYYLREGGVRADGDLPSAVRKLIESCIAFDPRERPHPAELVERLGHLTARYTGTGRVCAPTVLKRDPLPTPEYEVISRQNI